MNIRQTRELKSFARERVENCPEQKKLILMFSGITLGLALVVTVINYLLGLEINKTGGLSNMGTRAVLDTFSEVLPIVQSVIALCLELGFMAAMLRIARGQYVSTRTLKLGFDRFFPLLRLTILRGLIFLGAGFLSIYLGTMIYLITPFSDAAMELLTPLMGGISAADPQALLESVNYGQLMDAMIPCFVICGLLYAIVAVPMWYQYRLAGYILIDKPSYGAFRCLRESKLMMRRNRFAFFRLDLSMWYYHLGLVLMGFLAYGDMLLGLVGITLPVSQEVTFFGFYVLYLLGQFAIYFFLRNSVETTYCLAYDSLIPKETESSTVVLGNIFQM